MVKLYEVLKDITPLTYTGYYVEVPSLGCIKDYGQNYITKHNIHNIRRLTNPEQYEYVASAPPLPTPPCKDISDANGFNACLLSCSPNSNNHSDCSVTLQPNAMITLSNNITYPKMNLTIRANDAYLTNGISNEEWNGITLEKFQISLNNLDICGVNLSVNNNNSLTSALQCASGLIIREGNHMFYNNITTANGGAISANDITLIDASIIFRHNHSNQDGGAIYAQNSLIISGDRTNILFYDNSSRSLGGAIASNNVSIKDISNDISNDNKIMFYDNHSQGGGAIYTNTITIQNVTTGGLDFYGNKDLGEEYGGGAICSAFNIHLIDASIKFRQNYSTLYGGAIRSDNLLTISGDKTNIKFHDNIIYSEKHTSNGGAISTTTLVISSGVLDFCNNTCGGGVVGNEGGGGGAIYSNSNVQLIDATIIFRNNNTGIYGGAISANDISLIDTNIIFRQNHSQGDLGGGAIYAQNSLIISGHRTNILFYDNSSRSLGGAIASNNVSIKDISNDISNDNKIMFYDNHSQGGGAIYTNTITIQNVTTGGLDFYGNKDLGEEYGGGAICSAVNIHLIDASIKFRQNYSTLYGGAIRSDNLLTISGDKTNIKFHDNIVYSEKHTSNGGAISTTTLVISSGVLDFCSNKIMFYHNNSQGGGAIYSSKDIQLIDSSITFRNNWADMCGGAIYVGYSGSLTISGKNTNLIFHDNSAQQGGAIYMNTDSKLKIQHDLSTSKFSFQNNKPNAIYFDTTSQVIECPSFNNNITCEPSGKAQCTDLSNGMVAKS